MKYRLSPQVYKERRLMMLSAASPLIMEARRAAVPSLLPVVGLCGSSLF